MSTALIVTFLVGFIVLISAYSEISYHRDVKRLTKEGKVKDPKVFADRVYHYTHGVLSGIFLLIAIFFVVDMVKHINTLF